MDELFPISVTKKNSMSLFNKPIRLNKLIYCMFSTGLFLGIVTYLTLYALIAIRAYTLLKQPLNHPADVAVVLGNRAYWNGAPNPCLTGRVDQALVLAQSGDVRRVLFSGGIDVEDGRIEAEEMQIYARNKGYTGEILLEKQSSSTRENLLYSQPILQEAGAQSIVLISEPYHLWRVERLIRANPTYTNLDVQYAAAPTYCWNQWGMVFKGALREPLAIINNFAKGYFSKP